MLRWHYDSEYSKSANIITAMFCTLCNLKMFKPTEGVTWTQVEAYCREFEMVSVYDEKI